jgi:putative transposase
MSDQLQMFRSRELKLYPNQSQVKQLEIEFGCSRFIYNKMLEICKKKYLRTGKSLSNYDMNAYLPKLKKQYKWLSDASASQLQITCGNLAEAYNRFFTGVGKFPNFKKKFNKKSYSVILGTSVHENKIKLPKLGLVKFRGSDLPSGKLKKVTVKKSASGSYYAVCMFEVEDLNLSNIKHKEGIVGLDLGLKDFLVSSNGVRVKPNKFLRENLVKLKKSQKLLSAKQKGSKKRNQARIRVAKLHERIANKRKDFSHKVSNFLVSKCENQAFAVESLNIKGMVKNHKLAMSIADSGWRIFLNYLNYKANSVGKQVIEVNRFFPSSKTCSECGRINDSLQLSDRDWTCKCGAKHHRDRNASINIAKEAARMAAGGELVSLDSLYEVIKADSAKPIISLNIR